MFDFEWTGRREGDDSDHERGINAAEWFAQNNGIDAEAAYRAYCEDEDSESALHWLQIEAHAYDALTAGWRSRPDNVALVWR